MTDVRAIEPGKYNKVLADALKKEGFFEEPQWVRLVKTGAGKQRPNIEEDFWFKRAASILRQLYVHETVGVQRLRTRYGNRKDRGSKPDKFYRGAGKIIRVILQQAESAGLVEKVKSKKAGRKLTIKGRQFLENAAEAK
jgi:small subunit ribosomal protein S19e